MGPGSEMLLRMTRRILKKKQKKEKKKKRDARTGDICYLFRLSTVAAAHTLRLHVLHPSFPSVQQVTAHQTGFLFPRERDVSTRAQGDGYGVETGRPIESDRAPVRAEAKRTAGSARLSSALLQLCRVILPARPRTSFGYVHPGRNCHCPAGVITGPSKCLFF